MTLSKTITISDTVRDRTYRTKLKGLNAIASKQPNCKDLEAISNCFIALQGCNFSSNDGSRLEQALALWSRIKYDRQHQLMNELNKLTEERMKQWKV